LFLLFYLSNTNETLLKRKTKGQSLHDRIRAKMREERWRVERLHGGILWCELRAYEFGLEVSPDTFLLPVTSLPVLEATGAVLIRAASGALGQGLLLKGGGDNLDGEVEVLAKVLNALVGDVPVVPLPAELLLDVAAGAEGLHGLDHLKVGNVKSVVLLGVEVLEGNEDTVCKEILSKICSGEGGGSGQELPLKRAS